MVVYSHDWILVGLGIFALVCFAATVVNGWLDDAEYPAD